MIITGKRLTPFTMRVYRTLLERGPMRAGRLAHLLYPDLAHAPTALVGGTLGKLQRCGLVVWSPIDHLYRARRDREMVRLMGDRA